MRYKGTKKSLPEIARELHVDAVVEGTVMWVCGRVRISAQLIEAPTDRHIWAASYERDLMTCCLYKKRSRAPSSARFA